MCKTNHFDKNILQIQLISLNTAIIWINYATKSM